MDASDEVLVAELMLRGFFNNLTPAKAAAICACLVAPDMETIKKAPTPHPDLVAPIAALHEVRQALLRVGAPK